MKLVTFGDHASARPSVGLAAGLVTRDRPVARAAVTAAATWMVLGGRTLRRESRVMARHLDAGDLAAARGRLNHLCGRDPAALDEPELARATVESVAENTSDAVVAPLFWGALLGPAGLLGYRAANSGMTPKTAYLASTSNTRRAGGIAG